MISATRVPMTDSVLEARSEDSLTKSTEGNIYILIRVIAVKWGGPALKESTTLAKLKGKQGSPDER